MGNDTEGRWYCKGKVYLFEDPQYIKDQVKEWEEKQKQKEAELDLEEAPY